MAGKDSEGMSPVDESLQHVEESPDINRNPESEEKVEPLKKKAEVSREKRKTASQPSSSKTTSVAKGDFIESIKASISQNMVGGFRHISKSLSSDIAEVISNAGIHLSRIHLSVHMIPSLQATRRRTTALLEKSHEARVPRTTSPLTSL